MSANNNSSQNISNSKQSNKSCLNKFSNITISIGEFSKTDYPHSRELFTVIILLNVI